MANGITIERSEVVTRGGMVILPLKEYRRLIEQNIPTYYLTGKAATDLDDLVEEGMREYRAGKTRKLKSLADLD